jgi:hypothetical protein
MLSRKTGQKTPEAVKNVDSGDGICGQTLSSTISFDAHHTEW